MPVRRFRSIAILVLLPALALAACVGPVGEPKPDPQPPPSDPQPPPSGSRLFLAVGGGTESGLYALDATSGVATLVATGLSDDDDATGMGLAPGSVADDRLYAGRRHSLYTWDAGMPAPALVSASIGTTTDGLAHDAAKGHLYVATAGYLSVVRASDGARLAFVLRPPNQPHVEGLAFDPEERVLYGLARGYPDHYPDHNRALLALDVDAVNPAWAEVGDTGGLWAYAGLAFDLDARVLYAVGRIADPGALFRIEPTTGATTRVGATGLADASGGLAWR